MRLRLKVVVPVYRGASVIEDTLRIVGGQLSRDMGLAVVINGPADGARELVNPIVAQLGRRDIWAAAECLPHPSRSAALNAGDALGPSGGHRLYLDQDARLSSGALNRILAELDAGAGFIAGSAQWRGPSPAVLRAMRCWSALPYVKQSRATAGMYAVSKAGRGRWTDWPDGLPDDKFARMHFRAGERRLLEMLHYEVEAPRDFAALLAARRRYRAYNKAMVANRLDLMVEDQGRGLFANLASLPARHWPGAAILGAAELAARLRS